MKARSDTTYHNIVNELQKPGHKIKEYHQHKSKHSKIITPSDLFYLCLR